MAFRNLLTLLFVTLLFPFSLASSLIAAQPPVAYVRTWGGTSDDVAYGIAIDSLNNAYVTGYTSSFAAGAAGAVVLKFDSTGNMVWGRVWGGNASEVGFGLAVDQLGNTYVVGSTLSFGSGRDCGGLPCKDLFLLKFNSTGGIVWQLSYGGNSDDVGYGVVADNSGKIWVTGYTQSYGAGGQDVLLLEFTSDGTLLRGKTWGGNSSEVGYGVTADSSGSIYVAGYTSSFGSGGSDAILLKFDSSANLLWQRTWGERGNEEVRGVTVDPADNVYVTGYTSSLGAGSQDVILLKFSSQGDLLWQDIWGTSGYDGGSAVSADNSEKKVLVVGFTPNPSNGLSDVLLLRFDAFGSLLGQETWGGAGEDYGYALATNSAGDAFAAGSVSEAPPYNQSPTSNPTLTTSGPNTGSPSIVAVALPIATANPNGRALKALKSDSYAGAADIFLIKQPSLPSLSFSPALVVVAAGLPIPVILKLLRVLRQLSAHFATTTQSQINCIAVM